MNFNMPAHTLPGMCIVPFHRLYYIPLFGGLTDLMFIFLFAEKSEDVFLQQIPDQCVWVAEKIAEEVFRLEENRYEELCPTINVRTNGEYRTISVEVKICRDLGLYNKPEFLETIYFTLTIYEKGNQIATQKVVSKVSDWESFWENPEFWKPFKKETVL